MLSWPLFLMTFTLVAVAELPDKTAFAALLLSTSFDPRAVFVGAAAAFVIQSAVAVALGSVAAFLPERLVHGVSGGLFLLFAVLMWRRKADEETDAAKTGGSFVKEMSASFFVIFLAEWGDLTQLATATLVAKYQQPLTIFTSATLALWAVTAVGVWLGARLKHALSPHILQRVAAVAMAGVGVYLLAQGW
jgi:putative Ca2+/H+ antiporter (TMEM165/GDT1 family)